MIVICSVDALRSSISIQTKNRGTEAVYVKLTGVQLYVPTCPSEKRLPPRPLGEVQRPALELIRVVYGCMQALLPYIYTSIHLTRGTGKHC